MLAGENATFEDFLPFPEALKENNPQELSKQTARIIKMLYDSGVLNARTWGTLLDLEEELEKI
jgi:hypothetical protein